MSTESDILDSQDRLVRGRPKRASAAMEHVLLWFLEGKNCGRYLHQWARGMMSFLDRASYP